MDPPETPKTVPAVNPFDFAALDTVPTQDTDNVAPTSGFPSIPGYDLLQVLGRGGMGVVYKARHKILQRTVALKVIGAGPYASESELARFRIEAELVAQLHHPHVVEIYDVGQQDGCPYFSLEFLEGGDLFHKLNRNPLHPHEAAETTEKIARAIQAAHERGIIHRDLKPSNVLLTRDGQPKVTDFGLAKRINSSVSHTMTGTLVGTPNYMAPEQAEGRKGVGPAADIYGLGAILYELLTGRPPFDAESPLEIVAQVISQEPASPRSLNPAVPRNIETICLKCMEKDPRRRYLTAAALADDLLCFLREEPISARPPGLLARVDRWARLRPAMAATLAALTFFYLVHLTLQASGVPGEGGDYNRFVTLLVAIWGACAAISQRLYSRTRWTPIIFVWTGADVLLLTLLLMRGGGPQSALLPIYFLLIGGAALRLRISLVWFVTGLSLLSYLTLLLDSTWRDSSLRVDIRTALLFSLGLILLGLTQHILLRRFHAAISRES
ncbi:MAG: serine/threonine protein kinase [Candidatus Hydrogenedentes bacterium]|nr:serine/threonine protein kinase [Candidatus Hydrogenedentota bacterium]